MLTREGVNDKFVDDKGIDGNNMRENFYGHKRNINQKFCWKVDTSCFQRRTMASTTVEPKCFG